MNVEHFLQCLKDNVNNQNGAAKSGDSVLDMLYTFYSDSNRMDDEKIRADFDALYQAMNGMPLRDMDRVIYSVCTLCRDHEKAGFIHGTRIGARLMQELLFSQQCITKV